MREIRVWDLPTRAYHWAIVLLVVIAWATTWGEGWVFALHRFAGYGVLVLLVFRLFWGVCGNEHARFANFVSPPKDVWRHLRKLLLFSSPRLVGHSPLGGWIVLVFFAVLAGIVITGLFASDGESVGPWASAVAPFTGSAMREIHEGLANLLLLLGAAHIVGVILRSFLARDNLIRAMWTGRRIVADESPAVDAGRPRLWLAALILALLALLWWFITSLFGA
jgi:cytochrome b